MPAFAPAYRAGIGLGQIHIAPRHHAYDFNIYDSRHAPADTAARDMRGFLRQTPAKLDALSGRVFRQLFSLDLIQQLPNDIGRRRARLDWAQPRVQPVFPTFVVEEAPAAGV